MRGGGGGSLSSVATTHHHPRLWRDLRTCVRVRASYPRDRGGRAVVLVGCDIASLFHLYDSIPPRLALVVHVKSAWVLLLLLVHFSGLVSGVCVAVCVGGRVCFGRSHFLKFIFFQPPGEWAGGV